MTQVRFFGWKPGFRSIQFVHLLREKAGLSLKPAKTILDALMEGRDAVIEMPDDDSAKELLAQATELGAMGEVRPKSNR